MENIRLIVHKVTAALGAFITHFSNFCESKIDDGWLAEREDPKKLKKLSNSIATIVNRSYNKSWCLCQNGRRKRK